MTAKILDGASVAKAIKEAVAFEGIAQQIRMKAFPQQQGVGLGRPGNKTNLVLSKTRQPLSKQGVALRKKQPIHTSEAGNDVLTILAGSHVVTIEPGTIVSGGHLDALIRFFKLRERRLRRT